MKRSPRKKTLSAPRKAGRPSDAAVERSTGLNWARWFALLDKAGATKMDHTTMAAHLYDELGCPSWWNQMVAVAYEQERGLRQKHEKAGGFEISASKTIAVPVSALFKSWSDARLRDRWLGEPKIVIRKSTPQKSMRITWSDAKTSVSANFYAKGEGKSSVSLNHEKLAGAREAEKKKALWKGKLEKLKVLLEG